MPRKPREEVAGGVFHVFARGNRREDIYVDDLDRHVYLDLLARVGGRQRWLCLAYCLMDNHVHLLLETPWPNLGEGIQRLHGRYAAVFNRRHRRSGHLFQGRYGATRISGDPQFLAAAAYLALNPVAAGLCRRPEDWRWSSHAELLVGKAPGWLASRRLLELFGASGRGGARSYAEYIDERL